MTDQLLKDKTGIVFGVANKRSIAWAIAKQLSGAGAKLAFTFQGEKLEGKVRPLVETLPGDNPILPCDVTREAEVDQVFADLGERWGKLDFVVHSIAFAPKADLEGRFSETSRDGYLLAQEISSYSLVLLARKAAPLMKDGGAIMAMTYLGGERAVKGYNVMGVAKAALESSIQYLADDLGPQGIRVNAISAGPVNTLAARGVSGFTGILDVVAEKAPLRRNVETSEIASTALFLLSGMSSGVTGEVIHVDCGFHCLGL